MVGIGPVGDMTCLTFKAFQYDLSVIKMANGTNGFRSLLQKIVRDDSDDFLHGWVGGTRICSAGNDSKLKDRRQVA